MGALASAGLIAVAAIGTAWLMVPDAFPRFGPKPGTEPLPMAAAPLATPWLPPCRRPSPADPRRSRRPRCPAGGAALPRRPRRRARHAGHRRQRGAGGRGAPCWRVGRGAIGRARADARGEWVILPVDPLPPGPKELALLARSPAASRSARRDTLLLLVPEPQVARPGRRDVVTAPRGAGAGPAPWPCCCRRPPAAGAAPRPLQAPGRSGRAGRQRLGLDVVDYDEAGAHALRRQRAARCDRAGLCRPRPCRRCGGRPGRPLGAEPGHPAQLSAATPCGWTSWPPPASSRRGSSCPSSAIRLRRICWRDGRLVVQPGSNLWRIARRVYGRGTRYTVIYQAQPGADPRPQPDLSRPGVQPCRMARPRPTSSRSR